MRRITLIFSVLCAAHLPIVFSAEEPMWQAAGMSCVPTHGTHSEAFYITTAGVIKLKQGAQGIASFVCPIHKPLTPGYYRLRVFFDRNRSARPLAKVDAALRRRTLTELQGSLSHVANMLVADQRGHGIGSFPTGTLHSRSKQLQFDAGKNMYWVQLTLNEPGIGIEGAVLYRSDRREPEQLHRPTLSCHPGDHNCCGPIIDVITNPGRPDQPVKKEKACSSCADPSFGCPVNQSDQLDRLLESQAG